MFRPGVTLARLEQEAIEGALSFYNKNKVHAAQALGISTKTLYNKLEVYDKQKKEVQASIDEQRKRDLDYKNKNTPSPVNQGNAEFLKKANAEKGSVQPVEAHKNVKLGQSEVKCDADGVELKEPIKKSS